MHYFHHIIYSKYKLEMSIVMFFHCIETTFILTSVVQIWCQSIFFLFRIMKVFKYQSTYSELRMNFLCIHPIFWILRWSIAPLIRLKWMKNKVYTVASNEFSIKKCFPKSANGVIWDRLWSFWNVKAFVGGFLSF